MHPDHTGGLVPLIFYRNILRIEPKLTIYGPPNLKEYLMDSFKHQGLNLKFDLDIHNIDNHEILELENDISVSSIELEHKIPCWGYKFRDKNNSLVFIEEVTSTPLSIKKGLGCKDVKSNMPSQPEASVT